MRIGDGVEKFVLWLGRGMVQEGTKEGEDIELKSSCICNERWVRWGWEGRGQGE